MINLHTSNFGFNYLRLGNEARVGIEKEAVSQLRYPILVEASRLPLILAHTHWIIEGPICNLSIAPCTYWECGVEIEENRFSVAVNPDI